MLRLKMLNTSVFALPRFKVCCSVLNIVNLLRTFLVNLLIQSVVFWSILINEEFFLLIAILSINKTKLHDAIKSRKVHSWELKQTRRRRKRKRHLKMQLRVSAIIFQLFRVIMLAKFVTTILESNWNQRLGHKRTKLNIRHHMPTSSTQPQNRLFHVVERTITSSKCQKMKNARAKRGKILFFIVKYANLRGFCCRRCRGCLSSLVTWHRPPCSFINLFLRYESLIG